MANGIVDMKITFDARGIAWAGWMKALFPEVCPETVNVRNVKNQRPPVVTSMAVFEVQNRIAAFCAERCEIRVFAAVDDVEFQDIFVESNGCLHVRNPKGNRRNLLNHREGRLMKGKYSTLVRRETTLFVRFFCTVFFVLSQLGAVGLRIMSRR